MPDQTLQQTLIPLSIDLWPAKVVRVTRIGQCNDPGELEDKHLAQDLANII